RPCLRAQTPPVHRCVHHGEVRLDSARYNPLLAYSSSASASHSFFRISFLSEEDLSLGLSSASSTAFDFGSSTGVSSSLSHIACDRVRLPPRRINKSGSSGSGAVRTPAMGNRTCHCWRMLSRFTRSQMGASLRGFLRVRLTRH